MQEIEFEIDRDAVEQYFRACQSLLLLFSGFYTFGIGFILAWIHYKKYIEFSRTLCPRQANALRYRLEGNTLHVDSGLLFLYRKSIPLDRITDVVLVQGPLLRHFGIWTMSVRASWGQTGAALIGVRNPEAVRELILSQRQRIYGEKAADA